MPGSVPAEPPLVRMIAVPILCHDGAWPFFPFRTNFCGLPRKEEADFLFFMGELPYGFRRIAMDVRRLSVKVVSDILLREI